MLWILTLFALHLIYIRSNHFDKEATIHLLIVYIHLNDVY